MAAPENPGNILETVEESKNEIPESAGIEVRRVAGTSDSQQPKRILENGADVKCGADK